MSHKLNKDEMYVMPWDNEEDDDECEIIFDGMDFRFVKKIIDCSAPSIDGIDWSVDTHDLADEFEKFLDEEEKTCKHEWRKDTFFFSAKVYETCKICGKKKEDC